MTETGRWATSFPGCCKLLNWGAESIWPHSYEGGHPLKAACLPRLYPDPQHVWKDTGMLLICGIFISHDDFASQRGAGVNTGAGEKILVCVGLGGKKRELTVTVSEGQWPGRLLLWEVQAFPREGSLKYLLTETFQAFLHCAAKLPQQQLMLLRLQQPGLGKCVVVRDWHTTLISKFAVCSSTVRICSCKRRWMWF